MKQPVLLTILCGLSALAIGACGGGGSEPAHAYADSESSSGDEVPSGPVRKRGGDAVEATMGPDGGQLELANGARLEIPSGAFEEATLLVMRNAPATTAFLNQEDLAAVGPLVFVSPEIYGSDSGEIVFSIPLASLPAGYEPEHLQIANEQPEGDQREYAENTTSTRWHYDRAQLQNGRAVARFRSLPGMRLQFVVSK